MQYSYLEIATNRNNRGACEGDTSGGFRRVWASPASGEAEACLVLPPAPQCLQAPWSRVNHHGNGRDGVALNYNWVLPHFPSGDVHRCVFRMRCVCVCACVCACMRVCVRACAGVMHPASFFDVCGGRLLELVFCALVCVGCGCGYVTSLHYVCVCVCVSVGTTSPQMTMTLGIQMLVRTITGEQGGEFCVGLV